jgi:hypothetical protein
MPYFAAVIRVGSVRSWQNYKPKTARATDPLTSLPLMPPSRRQTVTFVTTSPYNLVGNRHFLRTFPYRKERE